MSRWPGALATGAVAGSLFLGCAWLAQRDPAAASYGAERMRCVTNHDAAAEARDCMEAVDRRYAPLHDGGRP